MYLAWFLVALFSAAFQTVSGFGYAVLMIAILPLFGNDVQLVATVMTISAFGVAGFSCLRYIRKVRFDLFIPLYLSFLPLEIITAKIALGLDQQRAELVLGAVLIIVCFFSILKKGGLHFENKTYAGISLGAIGGITAGFFAISGPPMAIYYLGCTDDKEEYLATISFTFILTGLSNVVIRIFQGLVNKSILDELGVSIAGLAIGCAIGRLLVKRISNKNFAKVTYFFISLLGAWYIISSLLGA